jgi:hypothetical protein
MLTFKIASIIIDLSHLENKWVKLEQYNMASGDFMPGNQFFASNFISVMNTKTSFIRSILPKYIRVFQVGLFYFSKNTIFPSF